MDSTRQKVGRGVGILLVMFPAMIATGFMPKLDVLPFAAWLAIATLGAGVGGLIASPMPIRGFIAGCVMGAGALLGQRYYVEWRTWLTGSSTFLKIELVLIAMAGAALGFFLYHYWAREKSDPFPTPPTA